MNSSKQCLVGSVVVTARAQPPQFLSLNMAICNAPCLSLDGHELRSDSWEVLTIEMMDNRSKVSDQLKTNEWSVMQHKWSDIGG